MLVLGPCTRLQLQYYRRLMTGTHSEASGHGQQAAVHLPVMSLLLAASWLLPVQQPEYQRLYAAWACMLASAAWKAATSALDICTRRVFLHAAFD